MVLRLNQYSDLISLIFMALAILMSLFVIYRNDNTAYRLGWILLINLVPIFGTLMYAFFGNKRPSRRIRQKVNPVEESHREELKQIYNLGEINNSRLMHTINYVAKKGPYPAWAGTKTKYYPLGDDAFPDLLEDLRNAKHYIFMEYFIIGSGEMWDQIYEVLKERARHGVEVRLIFDDVGSIDRLPLGFANMLEVSGIKTCVFNPLRPIFSLVYNNRDHRKITVIDGYIGHSGGYNIADEYINKVNRFGHWKDSGIRLEGDAVWNYTVMFLNMWNAFRPTEDSYERFRPEVHHPEGFDSDGIVQPFSDSPLDDENLAENVYAEIISQAEEYVYIFTPYLILDDEMLAAVRIAAKRGVDVRIVTPAVPDKKLVFRITRSYYMPLIEAGVKVYEYTPGFIHAKSVVSDGRIAVVGTINLDYRSLYLHFECGTLLVGSGAVRDLKEDCDKTFLISKRMTKEDCHTGFFGVLLDGVLRAMSPLL